MESRAHDDGGCCGICSDLDGDSEERHAPPLRRSFKPGRDTAGAAGRHKDVYLEAGGKAQLMLYTFGQNPDCTVLTVRLPVYSTQVATEKVSCTI